MNTEYTTRNLTVVNKSGLRVCTVCCYTRISPDDERSRDSETSRVFNSCNNYKLGVTVVRRLFVLLYSVVAAMDCWGRVAAGRPLCCAPWWA